MADVVSLKSFHRNVAANFVARAVLGLTTIAFTPAYVSILGIDGYGVVGTFAAFQAILYVFDLGLGLTLNRLLARLATDERSNAQQMRDALRTFEIVYWAVGLLLGTVIVTAAGGFASSWFRPSGLPVDRLSIVVALMGVSLAIQWPSLLYLGGLLGLERQLSASLISSATALIRGAGAVVVLIFVSPSLEAFFLWQIVASSFQTFSLRFRLHRLMPHGDRRARLNTGLLRSNARFAADLTGITILGTLLTQLDKVVLSRAIALSDFGYYVLAGTVASSVNLFVSPVFNAVFPRLAATAAAADTDATRRTYHEASQVMSVLIWPVSLVLITFAPEVLLAWLGASPSPTTVWLVRILVGGTALNGLMNVPYALMLASGLSKLPLFLNLGAVLVLVPFILYMTSHFGAIGGASAWLLLNVGYVSVGIAMMHRILLRGEARTWYLSDVALPLVGALAATMAVRLVSVSNASRIETVLELAVAGMVALCGSALSSSSVRTLVRGRMVRTSGS